MGVQINFSFMIHLMPTWYLRAFERTTHMTISSTLKFTNMLHCAWKYHGIDSTELIQKIAISPDQKRPPKYLELMLSNMLRPTFVPNLVVLIWTRASAALDLLTLPLSIKTTRPDPPPPHPCTPTPHPNSNPTAQHGLIDFPVAHHVSHCETIYAPFQLLDEHPQLLKCLNFGVWNSLS